MVDLSRRQSIAAAAGIFGAAIVPAALLPDDVHAAPQHPDAALLALGAELTEAWALEVAECRRLRNDDSPEAERHLDAIFDRRHALIEQIEATTTATLDGLLVKAQAMACCRDADAFDDEDLPGHTTDVCLARQIANWLIAQHRSDAHG